MVVASSSEVYGKSKDIPLREPSAIVIGPTTVRRWSYAYSKALDEFLTLGYFEDTDVPVTAVRLFNTVGPRQTHRFGMVVPMFMRFRMNQCLEKVSRLIGYRPRHPRSK